MNSLHAAGLYLIDTVFDLYLIILSIRLILAWEHASAINPIVLFIINVTQPIIGRCRRILPNIGRFELATLFVIVILEILKFSVVSVFFMPQFPSILLLLLFGLTGTLRLILNTFFFAVMINAVLSWIHVGITPITQVFAQLSAPILRPLRRIVPPIAGFDITPIPALIILQLLIIVC